jgi:hypothetical protein
MVFEWMHGKPHSKREAVDVAASAVMMVCFVVLSLSAVWSNDPPRPLALRICGAVGIVCSADKGCCGDMVVEAAS